MTLIPRRIGGIHFAAVVRLMSGLRLLDNRPNIVGGNPIALHEKLNNRIVQCFFKRDFATTFLRHGAPLSVRPRGT